MRRIHYDTLDSTNSQAHRLVSAGEVGSMLITAATQSAGRGRNGRAWQSPAGGVWVSAVWPISDRASEDGPERLQSFPLVVGLAAWEAIYEVICRFDGFDRGRLRIKWPNDLLLDDCKVCGILCETIARGATITHLVAGVGINVAFAKDCLQGELRHTPTTLHDHFGANEEWIELTIRAFDRHLEHLMRTFEREGFAGSLLRDVRSRLAYVGSVRTWRMHDQVQTGVIDGIDAAGRLLLDVEGAQRSIDSGELISMHTAATL